MKICLICVEIFAWGKYGGFGRATRLIGGELVKKGFEVSAIVPRRKGQKAEEILDGIRVLSFEPGSPIQMLKLFKNSVAEGLSFTRTLVWQLLSTKLSPG